MYATANADFTNKSGGGTIRTSHSELTTIGWFELAMTGVYCLYKLGEAAINNSPKEVHIYHHHDHTHDHPRVDEKINQSIDEINKAYEEAMRK